MHKLSQPRQISMAIPRSVICLCHEVDLRKVKSRDAARSFTSTLLDTRLSSSVVLAPSDTVLFLNQHMNQHTALRLCFRCRPCFALGAWFDQDFTKLGCCGGSIPKIEFSNAVSAAQEPPIRPALQKPTDSDHICISQRAGVAACASHHWLRTRMAVPW